MQYYVKKILAQAQGTEFEGLAKDISEKIFDKFNELKEIEQELNKIKKQRNNGILQTEKEFFEKLIAENQEDIEIISSWIKQNTAKAINDTEFYKNIYTPAKEAFELAYDRDTKLTQIVKGIETKRLND